MTEQPFTHADSESAALIMSRVPGWSGAVHYAFFKSLLADRPQLKSLLMLGVYHGRDIAFILDILARYHPGRTMQIVGVDKFNAEPCADWPEEKRGMTWEQAFGCAPPDVEAARRNTLSPFVTIIKANDDEFLAKCPQTWGCIYLDTAHDELTLNRQLDQTRALLEADGIVCGDDYSDAGTWGVKRAVAKAIPSHAVFQNWIWHAPASALLYHDEVHGITSRTRSDIAVTRPRPFPVINDGGSNVSFTTVIKALYDATK